MPEAENTLDAWGRFDQLRHGLVASVLGVAVPEVLKDVVEGMDGSDFLGRPLREAVAGLGGLGEAFGGGIARTIGEVSASVKSLWDMGGGDGMLEEFTRSVAALSQLNPLKRK